jgi:hypothetical protein
VTSFNVLTDAWIALDDVRFSTHMQLSALQGQLNKPLVRRLVGEGAFLRCAAKPADALPQQRPADFQIGRRACGNPPVDFQVSGPGLECAPTDFPNGGRATSVLPTDLQVQVSGSAAPRTDIGSAARMLASRSL